MLDDEDSLGLSNGSKPLILDYERFKSQIKWTRETGIRSAITSIAMTADHMEEELDQISKRKHIWEATSQVVDEKGMAACCSTIDETEFIRSVNVDTQRKRTERCTEYMGEIQATSFWLDGFPAYSKG